MADVTFTHHAPAASRVSIFGRIRTAFVRLADAFAKARQYQRTHDELSRLSDRELADLGMNRHNLRSVAYDAVYRA